MRLAVTYLNERIELLEGVFGQDRFDQYEALTRLYNRTIGPVTAINAQCPDLLDPSMYSSSCAHTPISSLMRDLRVRESTAETIAIPAGGKGVSIRQPLLGGLGEAAERLLAVLHFEAALDRLVFASYEQLVREGRRALGPDELPLFAPEQYSNPEFEYVPFHADTPLRWLEGREWLTGAEVLIPAQLVLMYYKYHPREARIGYSTSGGLAFHCDQRRAILHGLYEFVERDAVNVCWYSRLPPPRVDVDLADFVATHMDAPRARLSTPYIKEIRVLYNTLDIRIPVFVAIAVDESRQDRAFLAGGGAWSGRERALAQALLEIGQSRIGLKFYKPIGANSIRADSRPSEMNDFIDAEVYFGYAKNLPRVSWYTAGESVIQWASVPTSTFSSTQEEYEAAREWVRGDGLSPIIFDMNSAGWTGVAVTKVFIPQLTQASVPSHPYLGHPRFYELPRRLGAAERTIGFGDLNPDPMPFP